ncbi:MAG: hypothetical protein D6778_08905 [Nitrospirae bacterium]|nr:MAG: hypothetical protein D6778_08905 [Nitrospirota bacterium]
MTWTQVVTIVLPILVAIVVGIIYNNRRFDDVNRRFDDVNRRIDDLRQDLHREIDYLREDINELKTIVKELLKAKV